MAVKSEAVISQPISTSPASAVNTRSKPLPQRIRSLKPSAA